MFKRICFERDKNGVFAVTLMLRESVKQQECIRPSEKTTRKKNYSGRMKNELCPFGKQIKKALVDKGMTQEALAQQVGTTPKYMTHILFGTRSGAKYRARITAVLGIEDKHGADGAAS